MDVVLGTPFSGWCLYFENDMVQVRDGDAGDNLLRLKADVDPSLLSKQSVASSSTLGESSVGIFLY